MHVQKNEWKSIRITLLFALFGIVVLLFAGSFCGWPVCKHLMFSEIPHGEEMSGETIEIKAEGKLRIDLSNDGWLIFEGSLYAPDVGMVEMAEVELVFQKNGVGVIPGVIGFPDDSFPFEPIFYWGNNGKQIVLVKRGETLTQGTLYTRNLPTRDSAMALLPD